MGSVIYIERDVTLTGGGGPNVTSIVGGDQWSSQWGEVKRFTARYVSGDHVFTAFSARIGRMPAGGPVANPTLVDFSGRLVTPFDCFAVPDERLAFKPAGAMTPVGAPSALTPFYGEDIAEAVRRVLNGPWSLSTQWTVSGGSGSVIRYGIEFDKRSD